MLWPCVESPSSHGYFFFFFFLSQNPRGANATGSFAQHSRLCDVHILINFSRPFLGLVYYVKKPEIIVLLHTQIHTYLYLCRRIRLFWPYFWHHKQQCATKKGEQVKLQQLKSTFFKSKKYFLLQRATLLKNEKKLGHFRLFSQNCLYSFFQDLDQSDLVSKFSSQSHGNDLSMIDVVFWEDKNILYVCLITKK